LNPPSACNLRKRRLPTRGRRTRVRVGR
jgi:hypothetical protein